MPHSWIRKAVWGLAAVAIAAGVAYALRPLPVPVDTASIDRGELEVTIDEECSRILATRAPAAGDLRLIVAIIKTITDLERVGDEAEKIGFLASKLAVMDRPSDSYRELRNLGNHVLQMLRDAMDAFARMDVKASYSVVAEDEQVDHEYEAIARQGITHMMEDAHNIKRVMNVTWTARALERIGDHAKNICEYVIYMVEGRDVRHTDIVKSGTDSPA